MIMMPGGGYFYVGTLHEGLPVIKEINKYGYNTFVLKYRVGGKGKYLDDYEYRASKDLIRAVHFIEENYKELEVSKENYSLWGGSAGARTVSDAVYAEAGITDEEKLRPALAVIAYVFFTDKKILIKMILLLFLLLEKMMDWFLGGMLKKELII